MARVYIGTFWDHQLHYDTNRRLFQDEQHDLFADLQSLPRNAALRKLNDLIKRARLAKVHAYIIAELRKLLYIAIEFYYNYCRQADAQHDWQREKEEGAHSKPRQNL